jgi:hypothetical protein
MAKGRSQEDSTTLQMALVGYRVEKQKIEDQIRRIEAQLQGRRGSSGAAAAKPAVKRVLSAAARARIAAAQRKRWAEHRKRAAQNKPA